MLSALKTLPMARSQVLTISSREHLPVFPEDGKKDIEQGWQDLFARGPDLKKITLRAAFFLNVCKVKK